MEDEFRVSLEGRLSALRGHRDLLQEQLRETHRELNSVDRRIDAAEELYRREFDADPPQGSAPTPSSRRASRIRRRESGQPSWRDAMIRVLGEAKEPLHAREIWARMRQSGFETDAADPLRSVVTTAIRTSDRIEKTGPNTFRLVGDGQADAQLPMYASNGEPRTDDERKEN